MAKCANVDCEMELTPETTCKCNDKDYCVEHCPCKPEDNCGCKKDKKEEEK